MHARQLIDGASFGPDALRAIGQAFDAAWAEIAGNFGNDPIAVDDARYDLANALLSIANEDSRDAEVLKEGALVRMALDYRHTTPIYHELSSGAIGRTRQ
jgi:arginase family enzyme